ncbi:hypothetical protein JCM3774_001872 [Rhodotorula dairenensis]
MGAADDAPRHSGNTSCQSPVRVKREGCVDASAGSRELDHQAGLPYRSAIFCTETLEFPSKDAFFAYARLQLIQDCGYEAVPSKRKPKKISVRCERYGVDGCPFRLSAFREGDDDHDSGSTGWRISAQHCAWQHSHGPAQVPRVSQPTAQALPSPAKRSRENGTDSPPPRTAVLYTGGEQFASVDDFITQTRELSLERYEVACWSLRRSADFASVGCALRQPSRCGSTVTNQQRQASEGDVEGKDGCEVNGDDESGADPEDAGPGYCEDVTSETPIKIVPPAAPKVGDRFDTFNDAYTSFAVANILHLGKSITRSGTQKALAGTLYCPAVGSERACPFRAFLGPSRDGAHSTVLATSILHHNHVPRPALAADPTWRPPIRCKLVLAALAKSDSASQNTPVTSEHKAGSWDADTTSNAMKKLVRQRFDIFAAQRKACDDALQQASRESVESTFASQGPYLSAYRNYAKFCSRMDIPVFPMTYAMIALWMYDKCSTRDGYFHTYKQGLWVAAGLVESLWVDNPVFRAVACFDPDGTALRDFMKERVSYDGSKTLTPRSAGKTSFTPRKVPAPSSGSSDAEHSEYASEEDDVASVGGPRTDGSGMRGMPQIAVPGLPTRDSVFNSITEIYKAYVAALVPVYGISVVALKATENRSVIRCNRHHPHYATFPGGTCSWAAVCRRGPDGSWTVDFDASTFRHSHGPCKEILADPAWRPRVRNPDARAVLGLDEAPYPSGRVSSPAVPVSHPFLQRDRQGEDQPPRKKARLSAPASSTSSKHAMPPPPTRTRPPTSSDTRLPPPALAMPRSSCHAITAEHLYPSPISPRVPPNYPAAAPPEFEKPIHASMGGSIPPRQALLPPTSSRPVPAASLDHSSQHVSTVPQLDAPPAKSSVLLVSAFCAGLHPALVSMAQPLVAAGVGSLDALATLRSLGPQQLDQFLARLCTAYAKRCVNAATLPPLPRDHVDLFARLTQPFYTVFPPGKALEWSADFVPASMKDLFDDRERLFALQRTFGQPNQQQQAEAIVRQYGSSLTKRQSSEVAVYRRFCAAAQIPPWPVTNALRVLCVVARLSGGSYSYNKLWPVLTTLKDLTRPVFDNAPAYAELASFQTPPSSAFKTQDIDDANAASDSGTSVTSDSEVNTPGTPHQPAIANRQFATVDDALVACAIPMIKTYGCSARILNLTSDRAHIYCNRNHSHYTPRCSYHWVLNFDDHKGAWIVEEAGSNLSHNHGANPSILQDPTWRPKVYNTVVLDALRRSDLGSSSAAGKRPRADSRSKTPLENPGMVFGPT